MVCIFSRLLGVARWRWSRSVDWVTNCQQVVHSSGCGRSSEDREPSRPHHPPLAGTDDSGFFCTLTRPGAPSKAHLMGGQRLCYSDSRSTTTLRKVPLREADISAQAAATQAGPRFSGSNAQFGRAAGDQAPASEGAPQGLRLDISTCAREEPAGARFADRLVQATSGASTGPGVAMRRRWLRFISGPTSSWASGSPFR